ncbi:S24 family peptidase [Flavobacterium silvaticum]|uniref:Peptidase S24/S26A/S26B/S26C domain-containing protein n=1 Tax=Flavobacterium silvaticum TaxID=1852020 RepID=A0A972FSD9_9FLAO|nr:S24 family peptidase [Flavobacterium silvaticum]NMH28489.1 hypothetical protein [Flavobacterium silvaticum]
MAFLGTTDDYYEPTISLDREVKGNRPFNVSYLRVSGLLDNNEGIINGDIIVVDIGLKITHEDLVAVKLDGSFRIVRVLIEQEVAYMLENGFKTLMEGIEVCGVITHSLKTIKQAI